MQEISKLEDKLGYRFENKQLIIEALTHKSYKKPYNNERLEFLGDAVLDLIVGEYLYEMFPDKNEGVLSKIRASLVNEEGFAKLANSIKLGEYLFLSQAEENNQGREKSSLLSNAFEALIGAIYLESGLEKAREVSIRLIEKNYPQINLEALSKDYKTALQEFTQAVVGTTPTYKLLSAIGPDHAKEFEVAVTLNGKTIATAKGKSKKIAQKEAARIALDRLKAEYE